MPSGWESTVATTCATDHRTWRNVHPAGEVEMDGGLGLDTLARCVEAGANALVAGSAIYGVADRAARIAELRALAEGVRA